MLNQKNLTLKIVGDRLKQFQQREPDALQQKKKTVVNAHTQEKRSVLPIGFLGDNLFYSWPQGDNDIYSSGVL